MSTTEMDPLIPGKPDFITGEGQRLLDINPTPEREFELFGFKVAEYLVPIPRVAGAPMIKLLWCPGGREEFTRVNYPLIHTSCRADDPDALALARLSLESEFSKQHNLLYRISKGEKYFNIIRGK